MGRNRSRAKTISKFKLKVSKKRNQKIANDTIRIKKMAAAVIDQQMDTSTSIAAPSIAIAHKSTAIYNCGNRGKKKPSSSMIDRQPISNKQVRKLNNRRRRIERERKREQQQQQRQQLGGDAMEVVVQKMKTNDLFASNCVQHIK